MASPTWPRGSSGRFGNVTRLELQHRRASAPAARRAAIVVPRGDVRVRAKGEGCGSLAATAADTHGSLSGREVGGVEEEGGRGEVTGAGATAAPADRTAPAQPADSAGSGSGSGLWQRVQRAFAPVARHWRALVRGKPHLPAKRPHQCGSSHIIGSKVTILHSTVKLLLAVRRRCPCFRAGHPPTRSGLCTF